MLSALPELVAQWHPTKNGESSPQSIGVSSKMKVWWLGECSNEWDASVVNRVNGAGCPICAGRRVLKGFNNSGITS